MNRAVEITVAIFLIGFLLCLLISIPMTSWAILEEERETGIEAEHKIKGVLLTAAVFSLFWVVMIPFYILILLEKLAGKGGDK